MNNKLILKIVFTAAVFFILLAFSGLKDNFNQSASYFIANLNEREPDSNIVIIEITSSDIENIGPWPIKRNYYALLINTLSQLKVKKIGVEVFLTPKFAVQSLYDNLVVKQIEENRDKVVLSSFAGGINESGTEFISDSLSYPSPKILNEEILTGHINFIDENIIPVNIMVGKSGEKAFAVQLSEDKIEDETIHVNFISSWRKFQSYSLMDFFLQFKDGSDNIYLLKDKFILIGVSDPQIAKTFSSGFDGEIPGVAFHAFALDNILNKRWINSSYKTLSGILFLIFILAAMFLSHRSGSFAPYIIIIPLLLAAAAAYAFWFIQLDFASLIFLSVSVIIIEAVSYVYKNKRSYNDALNEKEILRSRLQKKEEQLKKLQEELDVTGAPMLVEKIKLLKDDIGKLKEKEHDSEPAVLKDSEIKNYEGIVYRSLKMNKIVETIKKVAPQNATVLILGESGTGKEMAANALHRSSKRKDENFIAINCGALSDNLLESELFGHVKGAFTGAVSDKKGKFEAADKGTIFLDEIGETSENFQVKLLRVLQSGTFEKVGSNESIKVDVRVIAATNKNLETEIKEKRFREDLFYRLNVIRIDLPSLAERKEDIEILAAYFLKNEDESIKFSKGVINAFQNYNWKGNVRELESAVKRSVIFAKSAGRNVIQLGDLPENISSVSSFSFEDLVMESLREKKFSHSSITETAKELNSGRTQVSENFRGYSFKCFVQSNYNMRSSAKCIAGNDDEDSIKKSEGKLETFLSNIYKDIDKLNNSNFEEVKTALLSKYKNLPQKFHVYLDDIIKHYLAK